MRADAGLKTSRRQKEKDERVAHRRGSSSTFLLHHKYENSSTAALHQFTQLVLSLSMDP